MSIDCRSVDAVTATVSDGKKSDSDEDDEDLLLAMKLSMTTTPLSPKPAESTAFNE